METPNVVDHLLGYFADVEDPRRPRPTTRHALEAILILTILATICGVPN
jgi:hypothetical protein